MECKFHIGQEVTPIHIKDGWTDPVNGGRVDGPDMGDVCVITQIGIDEKFPAQIGPVFICIKGWGNTMWSASAFKPIEKKEIDISIFTKMLTPTKETVS